MKSKGPSKDTARAAEQLAQPDTFVVRVDSSNEADVEASISAMGKVERLGESGLRLVRLAESHGDSRSAWRELLSRVPGVEWAAPALRSPEGVEQYPTGSIGVRFVTNQTGKSLGAFARAHHLQLVRKNEFVPSQATFVPDKPAEVFLPDRIREVADDPSVQKAWAETMSKYKRETG